MEAELEEEVLGELRWTAMIDNAIRSPDVTRPGSLHPTLRPFGTQHPAVVQENKVSRAYTEYVDLALKDAVLAPLLRLIVLWSNAPIRAG